MPGTALLSVLTAIDAANAADPTPEPDGRPAALVYSERMSEELARRSPDASEHLQIAARGQHVERWKFPRAAYPAGRAGYLAWRTAAARAHAERVTDMMTAAGYAPADRDRVARLLQKRDIKRNPEMQTLEDVTCLVFLRWYLPAFTTKHPPEALERILTRTARKMSPQARAAALTDLALPVFAEDATS